MLTLTALLIAAAFPSAPAQWTRRITESSSGIQANGDTWYARISDDRLCVLIETHATNLGGTGNILVHDLTTQRMHSIAYNWGDSSPVPSGSSRFALHSWSNNHGVEVTDCLTGTTDTILRDSGYLVQPTDMSSDGRYVLFHTGRGNLVAGDNNGAWDVFVFDRTLRRYSIASRSSQGVLGDADSMWARISSDGRYITYTSYASNLAPGDTNGEYDVYLHDRITGATILVSKDLQGAAAGGWADAVNADGEIVCFHSQAGSLVPGDLNNAMDVFAYKTASGSIERVSTAQSGAEGNGSSEHAKVSASGRFIAFTSQATNLVIGDSNQVWDVFVKDRITGVVERVSVDGNGQELRAYSSLCDISTDGAMVAFSTSARIAPGETNDHTDVFIRYRGRHSGDFADTLTLVSDLTITAGSSASLSMYGAASGSHWWLLASTRGAGSTLHGHQFGVGPGVEIVDHGYSSPRGSAEIHTPLVPLYLVGRQLYFEVATRDQSGLIRDSNLIGRVVQ